VTLNRYQPTPQEQAQRKKEALAERLEKLSRVRILEAIRKKLPDALSRQTSIWSPPTIELGHAAFQTRALHDPRASGMINRTLLLTLI